MIAKTLERLEELGCRSDKLGDRVGYVCDMSKVLLAYLCRLEELGDRLTELVHRVWPLDCNLPISVVTNLFGKQLNLR
jgi:hypothetical protein